MASVREIYEKGKIMGIPRGQVVGGNGGGNGHADDPVAAAILRQREMRAQRLDDAAADIAETQAALERREMEVKSRQLELDATKAEANLIALRQQLAEVERQRGGGQQPDMATAALIEMLRQAREEGQQDRVNMLSLINDRLEKTHEDLERARAAAADRPDPPSPVAMLREMMQLRQAMEDLWPRPPPAAAANEHLQLELARIQLDAERSRAQLAEEAAERQRRYDLDRERMQRDLAIRSQANAIEQARNDKFAGLLETTMPGVVAALGQRFLGTGGEGGPAPQHSPAGLQPPEGAILAKCSNEQCGGEFFVPREQQGHMGACPHCHVASIMPSPPQQG